MAENDFQRKLIKELKKRFPGCYVLKNDPNYIQGIPDLSVFCGDKWAMLEVKDSEMAMRKSLKKIPNQHRYIESLGSMSYASYIYPENKEDVLNDLERVFKA